jgi:hypothetical protein
MAIFSYEIKCCPHKGVDKHWYGQPRRWGKKLITSLKEAQKLEAKLLRKGHTRVILLKVKRQAINMSFPKRDAGIPCRRMFKMYCYLDHLHFGEKSEEEAS